ncbi:Phospholipase D3 [Dirofilaria immitis]|nr:Phospholipase D3 [Dirofilaria immitis]
MWERETDPNNLEYFDFLAKSGYGTLSLLWLSHSSSFSMLNDLKAMLCNRKTVTCQENCEDSNNNCRDWVTSHVSLCQTTDYIIKTCRKSCGFCIGKVEPRFDISHVPSNLQSIAWLIGIWRSNHGGKAIFPTIPTFTYGEQIEISLPDEHMTGLKALNYTAFAWGSSGHEELHAEYGYITAEPNTRTISLTTVMDNGNRDLPVLQLIREWTLLDKNTLQARLHMETLTHGMQEHTFIRYRRIYP